MAGLNLFTNNAATTLASGITNVATSLTVAAGTGAEFPTLAGSQYFYCTIANNAGAVEIIKVTARSTDTFTIVRGQDGTSGTAWSSGDKVELRLTRIDLLNFPQLDSTNTFALAQTFTAAPVFNGGLGTPASGTLTSCTGLPLTTGITGTLAVANGGTGQTTYTNGQLLIGNTTGNTLTKATITAGTGISVTNGTGTITIANTQSAGFSNMQVFNSPGTFTTPATTTQIKVTVVGGGGGGSHSGLTGTGSGGAGGGAAIYVGPVTASTPYTVTVGTGGAGGAAFPSPGTGGTGNTSSFGPLASATGGAGGVATTTSALGGLGSAGTLQFGGGVGVARSQFTTTPGPTVTSISGSGGSSYLGGGGNGVVTPSAGVAGRAYGGGGSGAHGTGSGGAGAAGVVIVEY